MHVSRYPSFLQDRHRINSNRKIIIFNANWDFGMVLVCACKAQGERVIGSIGFACTISKAFPLKLKRMRSSYGLD